MNRKVYKFRIYPTSEQETVLRKTIGCCRFVYNWALDYKKKLWSQNKESISLFSLSSEVKNLRKAEETKWLSEIPCVALHQSLRQLDWSFQFFFRKEKGYPKFRSRKKGGSFKLTGNSFNLKGGKFNLAKIKMPIKISWSRQLVSDPTSCTVSQNTAGQWFASFLCEEEIAKLAPSDKHIGIDLGIETFASTSDGQKFGQPKRIRKLRKKLARLQRLHSRKKKGSKNREKARVKVARLHQRIANVRTDFLHKLSTQLVRENQAIALEDLAVSSMLKDRRLSRCISEQGWRDFRRMLEYKCDWYGRELLVVDRWFPSSKTCSCCGGKASFGLETRQWACGSCGANHDRDVNAAKNILAAGLAVSARGADGRPTENYSRGGLHRSRKTEVKTSEYQPI